MPPLTPQRRSGAPAALQPSSPSGRGTPAPAPAPVRERETQDRVRPLDPYKVILHNDDHNTMDHVVRSLVKSVPTLSLLQATRIMIEAHNNGKAIVVTCPLELAELYRDRLQSFGLTATIESDA